MLGCELPSSLIYMHAYRRLLALGSHVTALAAQCGHDVRAVYRAAPPTPPPAPARILIAPDIFDPAFAADAVRGADAVVAAAGPNFTTRHNPRTAMTLPPDLHQRLARATWHDLIRNADWAPRVHSRP